MKSTKSKIIIAMLVIAFVLVSVVATIAIAFAIQQQNISTSLNISYTAVDIDGSVSGTYKVGGVTKDLQPNADSRHIGGTNNNELLFFANDTENAGTLEFPIEDTQINFTSQNSSMVMQYTFTNNGSVHYIASMSFDAELKYENMKVEYSTNGTDYSTDRYAVVVKGTDDPENPTEKSYWIRISIDKLTKNASFSGDFDWLLYSCDEQSEEYLSYEAIQMQGSNGSYSVSYNNPGKPVEALTIPNNINGDPVTKIVANTSATAEEKAMLKSVHIPASVTGIGANAFQNYTSLETVTFEQNELGDSFTGTGLMAIERSAFSDCSSLREIIIPVSVNVIRDSAFSGCTSLRSVIIPDNVYTIESYSFMRCLNLKNVTIGSGVIEIGKSAFLGCQSLTNVVLEVTEGWMEYRVNLLGEDVYKDITEDLTDSAKVAELINEDSETAWRRM